MNATILPTITILFLFGIVILILISGVFQLLISRRLNRILRNQFPEVWMQLGSYKSILDNSIRHNLLTRQFIRKDYRNLQNPEIDKICRKLQIFGKIYLGSFIILILAILFLAKIGTR